MKGIIKNAKKKNSRCRIGCFWRGKLKTELLDLPNTILIPHMGSATVEENRNGRKIIVNIKTFIDGHNPPNELYKYYFSLLVYLKLNTYF